MITGLIIAGFTVTAALAYKVLVVAAIVVLAGYNIYRHGHYTNLASDVADVKDAITTVTGAVSTINDTVTELKGTVATVAANATPSVASSK